VRPDTADDDPEVRILVNTNVSMSRHKAAAQAVHAALAAFGIPHGRVVVLGGRPDEVAAMDVVVRDAGRTEVAPGTLTAGAALVRRSGDDGSEDDGSEDDGSEDDGSGHPGGTDPR
jgi:peptidyl-tRNA hydrolase, PTH2 family